MNAVLQKRALNAHIFEKHAEEWYVEQSWCSSRLFDVEDFRGAVLDPACGRGQIPKSAMSRGLVAVGSDLVDRGAGYLVADFLAPNYAETVSLPFGIPLHVVSNPPFERGREFAERALDLITPRAKVAMIFPTRRLNAAGAWLKFTPLKAVYYLTPRPSMPPGEIFEALLREGKSPSGGKQDFCWLVWQRGYIGSPIAAWLQRVEATRHA